ncbi:MAG: nucleoside-diphosphate kinase [Candidatus Bathyarchaeia archaeon]
MVERTFVMLKPETVSRNLIGEVIKRIESAGFRVVAMKLTKATLQQAQKLYEPHIGKSFYNELIQHITSGPILPMIVEKEDAVNRMRAFIGATNPAQASVGTIRKDFGISITKNAIHAADSPQNAEREAKIFFNANEILE